MDRIEINAVTGQTQVIQLTAEEEAAAIARHNEIEAIEAPKRAQAAADAAAKAEAKADNIVQYLRDHTPAECAQYVQGNVTDLASAKAFLKKVAIVLCVLSKESLR